MTGERTLPDVPEENYWYQRHLVVYEWIAARLARDATPDRPDAASPALARPDAASPALARPDVGSSPSARPDSTALPSAVARARVVDMACGEGYGAAVLAGVAASVVGVDANPEAFEHARLRYIAPNLRYARSLVETYGSPGTCDAVTFLQTIEHVRDPVAVLSHFKMLLAAGGVAYISTPNLLTLAPEGAEKSENPWHIKEYTAHEFRMLCSAVFEHVELYGVYHARKLRAHDLALRLGWDQIHRRLGVTRPFYDRFTPALSSRDFVLANDRPLAAALDFVAVCQ